MKNKNEDGLPEIDIDGEHEIIIRNSLKLNLSDEVEEHLIEQIEAEKQLSEYIQKYVNCIPVNIPEC